MRKLWVVMMSLGLAGGLAFAEDAKDETEGADRAPGATRGIQVKPENVKKIDAGGAGGMKVMRPAALGAAGAGKPVCDGCAEAKAKCQEAAKTSETHTGTAQCSSDGCGMHHGCDTDGNCYAMKCAKCLEMKLAGQKGRCEECKKKGPGTMGAAAGPGVGAKAINQGGMQRKPAKPAEETEEAPK